MERRNFIQAVAGSIGTSAIASAPVSANETPEQRPESRGLRDPLDDNPLECIDCGDVFTGHELTDEEWEAATVFLLCPSCDGCLSC